MQQLCSGRSGAQVGTEYTNGQIHMYIKGGPVEIWTPTQWNVTRRSMKAPPPVLSHSSILPPPSSHCAFFPAGKTFALDFFFFCFLKTAGKSVVQATYLDPTYCSRCYYSPVSCNSDGLLRSGSPVAWRWKLIQLPKHFVFNIGIQTTDMLRV